MNKPINKKLIWIIAGIIICLLCIISLSINYFILQLGPTYQITDAKMVSCDSFKTQLCSAERVSSFAANNNTNICVSWVEVNRNTYDGLSIITYDKNNKIVFSYEEPQDTSSTQSRECKSLPITTITSAGEYRTEFIISGRPYQSPILWTIK